MSSATPPFSAPSAFSSPAAAPPAGNARKPFAARRSLYPVLTLLLVLLSTLLETGALWNGKVIDDHDLIDSSTSRGCGANPLSCFQHPQFGLYYRPLMASTFSLGADLHGTAPRPYHIENLLLHAADIALACWLFRLIFRREAPALAASALFALHPLHVPVTTFIGGRTDTLALFFLFWFACGLLKSGEMTADRQQFPPGAGKPEAASPTTYLWRGISLLGFTAALFTKEQCLPLILLVPLLGTLHAPPEKRRPSLWMLLFLLPALLLLFAAKRVIPAGAVDHPEGWDAGLRIEMVGRSLWYYAKAFFWPTVRTLHQSSLGPWDTPQLLIALFGFCCAGIGLAVILYVWPHRPLRLLALWSVLTLLLVLNIVPVPSQFIASYRAVLPLVGIAGLVGAFCFPERRFETEASESDTSPISILSGAESRNVEKSSHSPDNQAVSAPPLSVRLFALSAACLILSLLSLLDVPCWRSDLSVEQTQYAADPNFLPALAGVAGGLHNTHRFAESLPVYDRVVARMFPGAVTESDRIAEGHSPAMSRRIKSQSSLRYGVSDFISIVLRGRGGARQNLGMWEAAASDYRIALAFHPEDLEVEDSLARCYVLSDNLEAAERLQRALVTGHPSSVRWHRLGIIYYRQNRPDEAREALTQALAMAPANDSTQRKEIQNLLDSIPLNKGAK